MEKEPLPPYLLKLFPIPNRDVAELATKFAKISNNDVKVAALSYEHRLYSNALYSLQQSVEKSAKAFGLLIGTVKPQELLHDVRHRSLLSILLHLPEIKESVRALAEQIRSGNVSIRPKLNKLGAKYRYSVILSSITSLLRGIQIFELDTERLNDMDEEKMWLATLNLDRKIPEVDTALARLQKDTWRPTFTGTTLRLITFQIKLTIDQPAYAEYFLDMAFDASPRIFPLCLLTMWHEQQTRYPSIGSRDYRNPEIYSADKPLIKILPKLLKEAEILSRVILESAQRAAKMSS